jgi:CRP-like cAMP-binding protein
LALSTLILNTWPGIQQMSAGTQQELAQALTVRPCAKRATLALEGGLAWVVEGRVAAIGLTLDKQPFTLASYGPGQVLGAMALLDPQPVLRAPLSYVVVTGGSVAVLERARCLQLLEQEASLALWMARNLAGALAQQFQMRQILTSPGASERVCGALFMVAEPGPEGKHVLPAGIGQQDIAAYANTTRETVTRVMQKLQATGLVSRNGSVWEIDQAGLLAQSAQRMPE